MSVITTDYNKKKKIYEIKFELKYNVIIMYTFLPKCFAKIYGIEF